MNPSPVLALPTALRAAVQRIKQAVRAAAERSVDTLGVAALASANVFQRDALLGAQFELNRKLALFGTIFEEDLDRRLQRELQPRGGASAATRWDDLSLVDNHELDQQVSADRFGAQIAQDCELEQRDFDAYVGSTLLPLAGDSPRNPLRPEVIGNAILSGVDEVTDRPEQRKALAAELARALAAAMPQTYTQIVGELRAAGVRPTHAVLRNSERAAAPRTTHGAPSGPGAFDPGTGAGTLASTHGSGLGAGAPGAGGFGGGSSSPGAFGSGATGIGSAQLGAAHLGAAGMGATGMGTLSSMGPGNGGPGWHHPGGSADAADGLRSAGMAGSSLSGAGLGGSGLGGSLGRGDFGAGGLGHGAAGSTGFGGGDAGGSGFGGLGRGFGGGGSGHSVSGAGLSGGHGVSGANRGAPGSGWGTTGWGSSGHGRSDGPAPGARGPGGARGGTPIGQVDAGLMSLIRQLAFIDFGPEDAAAAAVPPRPSQAGAFDPAAHGGAADDPVGPVAPIAPVAPNLIRAHRDALRQASTGTLDHMVIDVIGSLFDQILSDPKVPPQMARQIARLQLPVLRAALGDPSFFSSRRHPVRRLVNRIASLGTAFEDLDSEAGQRFVALVRELVQEIVEGDFDQIELYEQKTAALEAFIVEQARSDVQQRVGAATLLEARETDLRLQQRYTQQLQALLKPLPMPEFVRDFVAQVWSQAMMHAVRVDGADGARAQRLRNAGRELVMSVQPKGSPEQRKAFLLQLPALMKALNEGMDLIAWDEAARKAFFGKLLPAHAESLKGQAMRTLDYNLLARQVDAAIGEAVPAVHELPPPPVDSPAVRDDIIAPAFTAEERARIGLIDEAAVDWTDKVDIDLGEPEVRDADVDLAGLGLPKAEAPEPASGRSLADHVQIGFAYRMHLDGQWHKVRLAHVSPGRSFFVFTRGSRHKQTISLTHRMLVRLCEAGRLRAFENGYLIERATARVRRQLAALGSRSTPA